MFNTGERSTYVFMCVKPAFAPPPPPPTAAPSKPNKQSGGGSCGEPMFLKRGKWTGNGNQRRLTCSGEESSVTANCVHNDWKYSKHIDNSTCPFTKPNILLILADDLGWGDVGYHGSGIPTPNIDRLAANGVTLESHYSQSVCCPSRAALFTGRYNHRYGYQHLNQRIQEKIAVPMSETFFPEKLQQCGYDTEMYGKWHLGFHQKKYTPTHRGFDKFLGFYGGSIHYKTKTICESWEGGGRNCNDDFRYNRADSNTDEIVVDDQIHQTKFLMKNAFESWKHKQGEKPFFSYLSLPNPHGPFDAVEPEDVAAISHLRHTFWDPNRWSEHNKKRDGYNYLVAGLDRYIGEIENNLRANNLWEDTVIMFTSDNGGMMWNNWPLRGKKGSTFEGALRTPTFVYTPNKDLMPDSVRGTVRDDLMHITDWFPTILDVAECKPSSGKVLDGHSQKDMIFGGNDGPRNELLHTIGYSPDVNIDYNDKNIRKNRWKSIRFTSPGGYNSTIQGVLRWKQWKLFSGLVVKDDGWINGKGPMGFNKAWRDMREANTPTYQRISKEFRDIYGDEYRKGHKMGVATSNLANIMLFDIKSDPAEAFNVAADNPHVVDTMLQKLDAYYSQSVKAFNVKSGHGPERQKVRSTQTSLRSKDGRQNLWSRFWGSTDMNKVLYSPWNHDHHWQDDKEWTGLRQEDERFDEYEFEYVGDNFKDYFYYQDYQS